MTSVISILCAVALLVVIALRWRPKLPEHDSDKLAKHLSDLARARALLDKGKTAEDVLYWQRRRSAGAFLPSRTAK